ATPAPGPPHARAAGASPAKWLPSDLLLRGRPAGLHDVWQLCATTHSAEERHWPDMPIAIVKQRWGSLVPSMFTVGRVRRGPRAIAREAQADPSMCPKAGLRRARGLMTTARGG